MQNKSPLKNNLRQSLSLAIFCVSWQLLSPLASAAIYGKDDRQDIPQVPQFRQIAKATALAIGKDLLIKNLDGSFRIDMMDSMEDFVCKDERFAKQKSAGECTGFLISDRLLVTAGHCLLPNGSITNEFAPFCESFKWIFDHNLAADPSGNFEHIPASRIYGCKNVIRAVTDSALASDPTPRYDFALMELDRPVIDIQPLTLAKSELKVGEPVFTIGHTTGLPAKYSGLAPVIKNENSIYMEANLDTQGGNSGGPVFNLQKEIVGILVSGHPVDFYTDTVNKCERFNVCDQQGLHCDEESKFPGQQTSNFIQKIDAIFPYLPKTN